MRFLLATLLLSGSAAWAECPAAPDISSGTEALFLKLQAAPSESEARKINDEVWRLWTKAPDTRAQTLLDQGMKARETYDLSTAAHDFDELVAYCPDYAEGYNQRAFVNFIRQDYPAALDDLDRALSLSPRHYGAISGKALTLMALGRDDEAQTVLREAVAINPWLSERHLLNDPPGKPL